jgi:hypothetical protein
MLSYSYIVLFLQDIVSTWTSTSHPNPPTIHTSPPQAAFHLWSMPLKLPYTCPTCPRRFATPCILHRHTRVHATVETHQFIPESLPLRSTTTTNHYNQPATLSRQTYATCTSAFPVTPMILPVYHVQLTSLRCHSNIHHMPTHPFCTICRSLHSYPHRNMSTVPCSDLSLAHSPRLDTMKKEVVLLLWMK